MVLSDRLYCRQLTKRKERHEDHNNFVLNYLRLTTGYYSRRQEEFDAPLTIFMATSYTTRDNEVLNFISDFVSEARQGKGNLRILF